MLMLVLHTFTARYNGLQLFLPLIVFTFRLLRTVSTSVWMLQGPCALTAAGQQLAWTADHISTSRASATLAVTPLALDSTVIKADVGPGIGRKLALLLGLCALSTAMPPARCGVSAI